MTLRREVCAAAAGAGTEHEFFARLAAAGVLVRQRHSTASAGQVTGYAVGLARHTAKGGGVIWYGGGKLAADLTLPKLRARWTGARRRSTAPFPGSGLSAAAARGGAPRAWSPARRSRPQDEAGFFARLREAGVLVRVRFSETNPGQVTGYSVGLPGHLDGGGAPRWYGGGRLSAGLTLPRLRYRWDRSRSTVPDRPGRSGSLPRNGTRSSSMRPVRPPPPRTTSAVLPAVIRPGRRMRRGPRRDTLHIAARALRNPELRRAADAYDRAARARYGQIPRRTHEGSQLRAAARLMALTGQHRH